MSYPDSSHQKLFKAILALKNEKEAAAFLRDLLTISEIDAAGERWEMARLLWTTNLSYKEIAKKTGGSTTTVTRVRPLAESRHGRLPDNSHSPVWSFKKIVVNFDCYSGVTLQKIL